MPFDMLPGPQAPMDPASVFERAILVLKARGHFHGRMMDPDGTGRVCAYAALVIARGLDIRSMNDPANIQLRESVKKVIDDELCPLINFPSGNDLADWNDRGRVSMESVISLFRFGARRARAQCLGGLLPQSR